MNDKKCDFFLNIANVLAVAAVGAVATLFKELIKENPNDVAVIIVLAATLLITIFAVTTYFWAYEFIKDE